jgi:hypothetical protein
MKLGRNLGQQEGQTTISPDLTFERNKLIATGWIVCTPTLMQSGSGTHKTLSRISGYLHLTFFRRKLEGQESSQPVYPGSCVLNIIVHLCLLVEILPTYVPLAVYMTRNCTVVFIQ